MAEEEPFLGSSAEARTEEEMLRRQAEYAKGRTNFEVIRRSEVPEAVRWAARNILWVEESRETPDPPNRFTRDSVDEAFENREAELRLRRQAELLGDWQLQELIFGGRLDRKTGELKTGEETLQPEAIENLIHELGLTKEEFWARWNVLASYRFHRSLGLDLETMTVKRITSPGHAYPEMGWLKTIGTAKETLPNGERLGTMVDKALHLWCDIGEGKVDGIRDIFYGPRFESEYQLATNYITSKVLEEARSKGKDIPEIPENEREYSLYWQDALAATRVAEEIFRVFDLDVTFDQGVGKDIKPEDWEEWSKSLKGFISHAPGSSAEGASEWRFEGGANSSDLGKICHFILRQVNEFGRDHPRAIVAPAVVGCYPNLTVNFMKMATVEVKKKTGEKDTVGHFNLWTLWREKGIPFGDLPWGEKNWEGGIQRLKEAELLDQSASEEEYEVIGISQDEYDIPYTLQHFYTVGTVWPAITRKDLDKAFMDIRNPNYLLGLNKGFENTFAIMMNGTGLWRLEKEKKTMTKLRQLQKVNMLIGVLVANTIDPNPDRRVEGASQITSRRQITSATIVAMQRAASQDYTKDLNRLVVEALDAAETSGFLSSTNPKDKKQLEREQKLLLRAIGKFGKLEALAKTSGIKGEPTRRGFLPSETDWFDEEELEAIKDSELFVPNDRV